MFDSYKPLLTYILPFLIYKREYIEQMKST